MKASKNVRFETQKNRPGPVFCVLVASAGRLLDFGLFVLDVLAHDRIVFFHHQFIRGVFLVLAGGVVMAGAGGRNQFDQISHDFSPST